MNLILDPDRFGSLGRLGILSSRGVVRAVRRRRRRHGARRRRGRRRAAAARRRAAPRRPHLRRDQGHRPEHRQRHGRASPRPIRRRRPRRFGAACSAARVDPRTVSYIETHGTGTLLGDPIEVRGLTLAYADPGAARPGRRRSSTAARIGSIKPNIGHLEAGAGVVGLIKVLLQLEHRTLRAVAHLGAAEPADSVRPDAVRRAARRWPTGRSRSMRVDGRDVAGAAPRRAQLVRRRRRQRARHRRRAAGAAGQRPRRRAERPVHVLALSGVERRRRCAAGSSALAAFVERVSRTSHVADVCLQRSTPAAGTWRTAPAIVAVDRDELLQALAEASRRAAAAAAASAAPPKVAFLFTGQGSQYAGMGRAALRHAAGVPRRRSTAAPSVFDDAARAPAARSAVRRPTAAPTPSCCNQTGYTQPALFALRVRAGAAVAVVGRRARRRDGPQRRRDRRDVRRRRRVARGRPDADRGARPADAGAAGRRRDDVGDGRRGARARRPSRARATGGDRRRQRAGAGGDLRRRRRGRRDLGAARAPTASRPRR